MLSFFSSKRESRDLQSFPAPPQQAGYTHKHTRSRAPALHPSHQLCSKASLTLLLACVTSSPHAMVPSPLTRADCCLVFIWKELPVLTVAGGKARTGPRVPLQGPAIQSTFAFQMSGRPQGMRRPPVAPGVIHPPPPEMSPATCLGSGQSAGGASQTQAQRLRPHVPGDCG